jgi:hypothetical protein
MAIAARDRPDNRIEPGIEHGQIQRDLGGISGRERAALGAQLALRVKERKAAQRLDRLVEAHVQLDGRAIELRARRRLNRQNLRVRPRGLGAGKGDEQRQGERGPATVEKPTVHSAA